MKMKQPDLSNKLCFSDLLIRLGLRGYLIEKCSVVLGNVAGTSKTDFVPYY